MHGSETLSEFVARCALAHYMTEERLDHIRSSGESTQFVDDALSFGWVGYKDFTWLELLEDYSNWHDGDDNPDPLMLIPPEVKVMRSTIDGRWLIEIDTTGNPENYKGPVLSVWLNDGTIWDNKLSPEEEAG